MTALETPFVIGQQMWMAIGQSEQVTKPCPVCNGDRAVTIILGTGEHVTVMCDGCGLGFEGPRGYIQEWEHHPRAVPFVIASVKSFRDDEWELLSTDGAWASFSKLFQTEDEAREAAAIQAAAQRERNMQSYQHTKRKAQHLTWTVQYHRGCIKDLQRQITWHEGRVFTGDVTKRTKKATT